MGFGGSDGGGAPSSPILIKLGQQMFFPLELRKWHVRAPTNRVSKLRIHGKLVNDQTAQFYHRNQWQNLLDAGTFN